LFGLLWSLNTIQRPKRDGKILVKDAGNLEGLSLGRVRRLEHVESWKKKGIGAKAAAKALPRLLLLLLSMLCKAFWFL